MKSTRSSLRPNYLTPRLMFVALALSAVILPRPPALGESTGRAASARRAEVESLLKTQTESWSQGDLDTFCSFYSTESIFVSPSGVTHGGPEQIRERYRKRYSDAAAMGRLQLDVVDYSDIGKSGAVVVARWTLSYSEDETREDASGMTLLVLRKERGRWVISRDASM